jgi:protein-tyrosine phosphatase
MIDAHRIAPKLWMGGRPSPEACQAFDVVVLCAEEHQPELPCETVNAPIDDAKPTEAEILTVIKTAKRVNALRSQGRRVLVTCYEGRNRSGLVVALAMMLNGSTARSAVHRIRSSRRPPSGGRPLSNEHFLTFLKKVEPVIAQQVRT